MVNPPWIFGAFWKVISKFLDPLTAKKIEFIKNKTDTAPLLQLIEPDQLEEDFGGTNTFKLDLDAWIADQNALRAQREEEFRLFVESNPSPSSSSSSAPSSS